ncbi:MAG: class I SAM-dependent DNA methyltransferase [Acidimicrobiales bacterium]
MPEFARFDQRRYPTVSVRDGYREWVPSYEATVEDEMDLALLDRIDSVSWASVDRAVDLGCGTGRTGAWLRSRGVAHIDGVDLTPEMLAVARRRGVHDRLVDADVCATGLAAERYDLAVCCLVDEHLPELTGIYREAGRLLRDGGSFVIVGLHPFFIMSTGMPTHFDQADGSPVAVETHVHLPSDHVAAARAAGLTAVELHERLVDDAWIALKPGWADRRDWPVSYAWVWSRAGADR